MHVFKGKWISTEKLAAMKPRNVFHRQIGKTDIDCSENRNSHVLFRREFDLKTKCIHSLFHITMSYAALFIADVDLQSIFC